jgi:sulfoxide reductase heme-binding subunit YedZ
MLATSSTALWYTTRATGIVALVLLTATMVLGILTAGRLRARRWPAFAQADLHKRISLLAMVFLGLHVVTAVLDTYVSVGWASVIVPFASPYRPLWTGLGTVAVDLLVAVAVSSALRQRINARTWRGIHWLAYGSWPVAMVHSLGIGTDAAKLWMDALAALCTMAVIGAVAWRVTDHQRAKERAALVGATTRAVSLRRLSGAASPATRPPRVYPPVGSGPGHRPSSPTATATVTATARPTTDAPHSLGKDRS